MLPLAHREHNPFLGWRGIRVLLDRPELLRPQLRALLRASVHGPLQMLLPMVTQRDEVVQLKAIMQEVRSSLVNEGHSVPDHVPLGVMVEVPSVALRADRFAAEVDFFSIGTNDLTQYVLAVDRSNDLVASHYDALHPAVLTLIQHTIEGARAQDIPVSLCGEIGSVPQAIPILLGLGLDAISASPTYLPHVKQMIRAIRLADAEALAADVLAAADVEEVHALNTAWLREYAPDALDMVPYQMVFSAASDEAAS
jgi:phosphotransferase system enzyme I (PtsI)